MRVLVVSNVDVARPFGDFTRPYFLSRALAGRRFEVGLVGIDCSGLEIAATWSVEHRGLPALVATVRRAARVYRPDVIYAHQNLPGAASVLARTGIPVVADLHSIASQEYAALARRAPARRAAAFAAAGVRAQACEELLLRSASGFVAAGRSVSAWAARKRPRAVPVVVPNGVDPRLLAAPAGSSPYARAPGTRHAVCIMPTSSYPANDRAFELLREVCRRLDGEGIAVHVLGTDREPGAPHLHTHGIRPLVPWLAHADACLLPCAADAPLRGGARNKLLESLALGRRLVTTREGLREFEQAARWPGVRIAPDDPDGFAVALRAAVEPSATVLALGEEERSRLSWDARGDGLARALEQAVDRTA